MIKFFPIFMNTGGAHHYLFCPIDMGQIYDMLYQKLGVPDYTNYLCTCIYVFGQTGGVIRPLSLCPLLVTQVIIYIIFNMQM